MSNFGFTSFTGLGNDNPPGPSQPITPNLFSLNSNNNAPSTAPLQPESDDMLALKKQISDIVSRYPNIQLRSTFKLLEKLNHLTEEELINMLRNAQNDIAALNGTPGADFILSFIGALGDNYIPGFLEECMNDTVLQQDIENQIFNMVGVLGPTATIPLRMAGCASRAKKRTRDKQNWTTYDPQGNATQTGNINSANPEEPNGKKQKTTNQEEPKQNNRGFTFGPSKEADPNSTTFEFSDKSSLRARYPPNSNSSS